MIGFSWSRFKLATYLIPIVHTSNEYPIKSINYAPAAPLASIPNIYAVSNQRLETHSLKYPYQSNCNDYNEFSRSKSIRECVTQLSIKRLRLLPYSQLQYETGPAGHHHSSFKMSHPVNIVHNQTLLDGFNAIRDECNQVFKNRVCYIFLYNIH